jgi:hypothetical protein
LLSSGVPLSSYGSIGQYAIVATTTLLKVYLKKYLTDTAAGTWVEVGTSAWAKSWPTTTGSAQNPTLVSGNTLTINGQNLTGVTTLSALSSAINANSTLTSAGVTSAVINGYLNLYSTGVAVAVSGTSATGVGITAGSYLAPALTISTHTSVPLYKIADQQASYIAGYPTGSLWIKTTSANLGSDYILKKYSSTAGSFQSQTVGIYAGNSTALYTLDFAGGGLNLPIGTVYAKYNDSEVSPVNTNIKFYIRSGVGATTIKSNVIGTTFTAGTNTFTLSESLVGNATMSTAVSVSFTATAASPDANLFLTAITAAGFTNVQASLNSDNSITISHKLGGEIKLVDTANDPLAKIFSTTTTANYFANPNGTAKNYVASLWSPTVSGAGFITVSSSAPTNVPADGQLWYNSAVSDVDVMIHNGTTWVGYLSYNQSTSGYGFGTDRTDPAGPIISATQPTVQSDGTALAHGDL